MWYKKDQGTIDLSLPIFAETRGNNPLIYILIPQIAPRKAYRIIGYNWFSISEGRYNSCSFFKTAEQAISEYEASYKIFNGEININNPDY